MQELKHYHPLLVTLHWLVAVLVGVELYIGLFALEEQDRSLGAGGLLLAIHMVTGIAILALVIVRFIVRLRSKSPVDVNAGNPFLRLLEKVVHYGLYLMLIVITVIGLVMAIQTRRLQSIFLGQRPPIGQGFRPDSPQFSQGGQPVLPGQDFQPPQGGVVRPEGGFEGGQFPRRGLTGPFLLRGLHQLSAYIILLLVGVHVLATLYHLVVRRDNILRRMWYGAAPI